MTTSAHGRLRTRLHRALRSRPSPLLAGYTTGEPFAVPGATLWSTARTWVRAFRDLGLQPGDRVLLALPPSRAHVAVTIAAWWEGITLCPTTAPAQADLDRYQARVIIPPAPDDPLSPAALAPGPAGEAPSLESKAPRPPSARTEGIALILATSGTAGDPKRIALSFDNLLHQLTTHTAALAIRTDDVCVSCLPWHHAFGLLVDLWPALLSGATVHVDPAAGKDPAALLGLIRSSNATRCSMVPLHAQSLLAEPEGPQTLADLQGVIGGAPITRDLSEPLSQTNLRVGYGQTECSPGITLGKPGDFAPGALGRPLACRTEVRDGELVVRGPNVCAGYWTPAGLDRLPESRWHNTGDLVERAPGGDLRYVGRTDHRFKLANGRMVDAPAIEARLQDALRSVTPIVTTPDGRSLHITLVTSPYVGFPMPRTITPADADATVATALGGLAHLPRAISELPTALAPRTRKGELDRLAISDFAAGRNQSPAPAQPIHPARAA